MCDLNKRRNEYIMFWMFYMKNVWNFVQKCMELYSNVEFLVNNFQLYLVNDRFNY